MTVVVLGSANADIVLSTPRLPSPGETIRAREMTTHPGGKGANQAIAAARMGAATAFVGRVGDDEPGRMLRATLEASGVDVAALHIDPDAPTGTALITVADDGTNTIVTSGGANHRVGAREIDALRAVLPDASVLVVQLEIPMDVVAQAVELAVRAGVPVVLDPAPVADVPDEVVRGLAWITPNETEAAVLCRPGTGVEPADAASRLRARGVANAVVTTGERGCVYAGEDGELVVGAPSVVAVDTVACGDAFTGALAASLASGAGAVRALEVACAAGALAATKPGASTSLPTAEDVGALLGPS